MPIPQDRLFTEYFYDLSVKKLRARVHQTAAAGVRAILGERGDFTTVLLGAGLVLIIRVLASAVGYASMILLARWMGPSEYGLYSFAIAWMTLFAYPATLGLPGAGVRFVAQYSATNDWEHVVGFMKVSSWLAFGCGALIATLAILAVLCFKLYLNPGFAAPTIVALAGIPVVALTIVRSEAIRGLGWLVLAWGPLQLGQPLLLLIMTAVMAFIAMQLTATLGVGASIIAYAANLIAQRVVLHARLGTRIKVEPKVNLGPWLGVALSFVWISLATVILIQAGVIVAGIFLSPRDVAIYSAAAATSGLVAFPLYAATALSAPRFAALYEQQCHLKLQTLTTNVIRWTFWPSLAMALIFVAFGSIVLRLFGPGFEQGYAALLILTLGQLAGAFAGPVGSLLNMTGHQFVTARVLGASAILGVVFAFVFTRIWGSFGTAVAFSGAMVLSNAWLAIFVVRKLEIYPSLPVGFHLSGVHAHEENNTAS
jgi:O-antigen/teichoic acid export membrane protein